MRYPGMKNFRKIQISFAAAHIQKDYREVQISVYRSVGWLLRRGSALGSLFEGAGKNL
jgi:hypothetical protein